MEPRFIKLGDRMLVNVRDVVSAEWSGESILLVTLCARGAPFALTGSNRYVELRGDEAQAVWAQLQVRVIPSGPAGRAAVGDAARPDRRADAGEPQRVGAGAGPDRAEAAPPKQVTVSHVRSRRGPDRYPARPGRARAGAGGASRGPAGAARVPGPRSRDHPLQRGPGRAEPQRLSAHPWEDLTGGGLGLGSDQRCRRSRPERDRPDAEEGDRRGRGTRAGVPAEEADRFRGRAIGPDLGRAPATDRERGRRRPPRTARRRPGSGVVSGDGDRRDRGRAGHRVRRANGAVAADPPKAPGPGQLRRRERVQRGRDGRQRDVRRGRPTERLQPRHDDFSASRYWNRELRPRSPQCCRRPPTAG